MTDIRKCPLCETAMQKEFIHSETVDRCKQCNGIYFDEGELENISHIVRLFQNAKMEEEEIEIGILHRDNRYINCPVDNKVMKKHSIAGIILDICPECNGIWLDDGEVQALKIAENHIKQNLNLYLRLG
jgi:Zn-finger nucleic acid-binding protein